MNWLRRLFELMSKIARAIAGLFTGTTEPEEQDKILATIEKEKPKKKKRPWRSVRTSRGGLSMPKHQPCPMCQQRSKRREKTRSGAHYVCPIHGTFLVLASRYWVGG